MKKVTLTIATILLAGSLFAQDFKPPAPAVSAMKAKYPTAEVDEWYDDETELICYFEDNGEFGSAFFTKKGVWIRSEFPMDEMELGEVALDQIFKKYKDYEIMESLKVTDTKGTTFKIYIYNAIIESDYLITVDKGGKIISEENLTVEDDSFE